MSTPSFDRRVGLLGVSQTFCTTGGLLDALCGEGIERTKAMSAFISLALILSEQPTYRGKEADRGRISCRAG
jgi:hypothetical protein